MAMSDVDKKGLAAEFVGSFALLFGAGLLSMFQSDYFSYGLAISLTYAVLTTAIYQFRVAQLNPILTLTEIFAGRVKASNGAFNIGAQFLGACLGATLSALICGESGFIPAGVEGAISNKILLAQGVFCTILAFSHIELSAEGGRLPGITVALVTYAAYTATAGLSGYLNPAIAVGSNVGNALQGNTIYASQFFSFVIIPFLAAAAGWGLYKLAVDNLLLSELIGSLVFTYCACCALAGGIQTFNSALSIGCIAAALVYTIGWKSGGAINPAVSIGTLGGGNGRPGDVLMYSLFQFGGGALGAFLARHTMGPIGLLNILRNGDNLYDLVLLFVFSMLLMAAYVLTFGDVLGRPAGVMVGLVYWGFHMFFTKAMTLNVQTAFGIIVSQWLLSGEGEDWGNSLACLGVPCLGSLLSCALLSLLPSKYQRIP
ncbi:aquaporin 2 [Cystoisospora suis]|uniref:Aquaporin 2 n=1 Tax=Cystoisospora suis TaxID=483139 RepID=A0A2C6K849_9APIC|nr:aquaporin 2 [Cystoisospora suis]